MLTLQILAGWIVLGTVGSILLLLERNFKQAKVLFVDITIVPSMLLVLLILLIGFAPIP